MLKDGKDYLFFFFITLLFAYVIGLTIVSVINKRFSEISINIPTPQVNFQMPPSPSSEGELREGFVSSINPTPPSLNFSGNLNYSNDDLRGFIGEREYQDCTEAVSQDRQEKEEQMNRVCLMKHEHNKYLCSYGKTNYMNPNELDVINRRLYQYNYFSNMTLQDYVNWLWLYQQDPDKLCYEHHRNLMKLLRGESLKYQPGICPPKINAQGSFSYSKDGTHDLATFFQQTMKYVGLHN